jgi:hypothetical protein
MIKDILDHQRKQLDEQIENHTVNLVRGTPSRDEDQRVRGILRGLQLAKQMIDDTEERLRKAGALE